MSSTRNRDSYNKIASSWDQARKAFNGREAEYLRVFLEGLPPGAPILDLGCGTGRPFGESILARGYRLTGLDQAGELLALARRRLPQAEWIESRIEDFQTEARFTGIVCWDALFHIDREHHHEIFLRVAKLLLPGGRFMLTVGGSEGPAFTDRMFDEEFFYDSHTPDRVVAMLSELGFEMLVAEFMDLPTGGRDKGRYAIVCRLR